MVFGFLCCRRVGFGGCGFLEVGFCLLGGWVLDG